MHHPVSHLGLVWQVFAQQGGIADRSPGQRSWQDDWIFVRGVSAPALADTPPWLCSVCSVWHTRLHKLYSYLMTNICRVRLSELQLNGKLIKECVLMFCIHTCYIWCFVYILNKWYKNPQIKQSNKSVISYVDKSIT